MDQHGQNQFNDHPIINPSEDRYGVDHMARAIAKGIRTILAPTGWVIAINGAWGAGKSSVINLILHHLEQTRVENEIVVLRFDCWWFRGVEPLAIAFLRELYFGIGPSAGKIFQQKLRRLGARLVGAGSIVGGGIDLAGGGGLGTLFGRAIDWVCSLFSGEETLEQLHTNVSNILANQSKRFVIVIDDIDRLSPDEALLIFRLVKSVGHLPKVIYLLAYDRLLAEKIVADQYPTEGPHYLEKIVQAAFEVPQPHRPELSKHVLKVIEDVCGQPTDDKAVRFMNIFYEVVAPEMKTPRDLSRLMNAISITWPALFNEVDLADFVALETFRVLRPKIYQSLQKNKDRLCNLGENGFHQRSEDVHAEYNRLFLDGIDEGEIKRLQRSLMRIFPPLERIWSNMHYGSSSSNEWAQQRRACSSAHFDTYFRFSLSEDTLSRTEIDELVAHADEPEFVINAFRNALLISKKDGGTKASQLLDELNVHADRFSDDAIQPFISALFSIADEINVPADEGGAFSLSNNDLRIHWLIRRLTLERFSLEVRSQIFELACAGASLGWLASFTDSAYRSFHPTDGKNQRRPEDWLTSEETANRLRESLLNRIRDTASTMSIFSVRNLAFLLFLWREIADDDGVEVKNWSNEQLKNDQSVVYFAQAFTSYSWSQSMGFSGMGDVVAKRHIRANVSSLDEVMDKKLFRERVETLSESSGLSPQASRSINDFLEAWIRSDKNPRD